MKKLALKIISILMVLVTLFTIMPLNIHAEEPVMKINAPIVEIVADKKSYGLNDSACITVSVSPSEGHAVEDVFVGMSIDNQLIAVNGGEFSKELDILTDETICNFNVALSQKASGLNFFQKIIMFFRKLFGKGHSAVEIPEYDFNDGRAKTSESIDISFSSITGTVTVNVWYKDEIETTDTDGDGLIDYIEKANSLNPNKADTDSDGLNDYDEFVIIGTDPVKSDTDGNGTNDFDDDNDADGLSNGYEIEIGTSANSSDTDGDGLNDKEELETYYTNPTDEDTDDDGATDGWEVENDFDPTWYDESFDITVECENGNITASVNVNVTGETAESISVESAKFNPLIDETIPGYLGSAFDFNANGDLGIVEIAFSWDESEFESSSVNPQIYCLNEEKQSFYEMETTVDGCTAKTVSTHFSTYILLDKNVYERYYKETYNVDYSKDSGIDSNYDGISDYVTKLMCDGIIRTGTGTKVFGEYTYEQVQANDDIDDDGIKNGDEITVDYQIVIPDDVVNFNGHYYKRFDQGEFCQSAQSYCESIGGYLCTITSSVEQSFVVSLLDNAPKNVYWLGGICNNGNWEWLTSEKFSYSKWGNGEPNNMEGSENYLQIYAKDFRAKHVGDWNDASNVGAEYASDFYSVANTGFICEWGTYEVNGHTYTFINSSPIYNDSDKDGFEDVLDPTPISPVKFRNMSYYIDYKHANKPSITLLVAQPEFGSNAALANGFDVGHSFVLLNDGKGNKDYYGFYPNSWEDSAYSDYISYTIANIYSRGIAWTGGQVLNDAAHKWNVACSESITEEQYNDIQKYINDNINHNYNLQSYNCTTFAVNAVKAGNTKIGNYVSEHLWAIPPGYAAFTFTLFYPYGYCPGSAGYDIMINAPYFISTKEIVLNDGSKVSAIAEIYVEN